MPPESPAPPEADRSQDPRLRQDARQVLELVETLSRRLERLRASQARAAGLRSPAFALLEVVRAAGKAGVTVSDAAYDLGVRPQALSGAVAELAEAGLLERERDPADGRARRLYLTPAGAERLAQAGELGDRLLTEVLQQVPAPNVARLVLGKLDAALTRALT